MSTTLPAPFPDERGTRRWLTAEEEQAWRMFRRMLVAVVERTARDLAPTGLSPADYDVLSTLMDDREHQWGLREMAEKMEWSRSRLSRQLSRMEDRGLIARHPDADDGRGVVIELTEDGLDALRAATSTHLASVRRRFVDRLTGEELAVMKGLAERIAAPE